ncbi:MAG TPA: ABC transporter substrate-binding protein [Xanthobacteraceae bacterium]|jgi:4,5-dihydroxyphthalate decarboxylase
MPLHLSIACRPYDRVAALMDGRVAVEGCTTSMLPLPAEEIFSRAYGRAEFDVTELSMSSHIVTTEKKISPYVGIPVFISRMFRHQAIYVRNDRGILAPKDLCGKTLGVPEYQMTAALWVRGMLSDVYGVRAEHIAWRTGGLQQPGRREKFGMTFGPPLDVQPIPSDQTLDALLARGDLDGIVTARPPPCFLNASAPVQRLFPEFVAEEQAYFARTGLFPIMHLIGIRKDIYERNPWLASSLFKAFEQAKAAFFAGIEDGNALQVTLPWSLHYYAETRRLMGADYWPYGLAKNGAALDAMLRYSREQGLTSDSCDVGELFAPCEEAQAQA